VKYFPHFSMNFKKVKPWNPRLPFFFVKTSIKCTENPSLRIPTSPSPESDPWPSCAKAFAPPVRPRDPAYIAPEAAVRSPSPAPRGASPTRGLGAKCDPRGRAVVNRSPPIQTRIAKWLHPQAAWLG